MGTNNARRVSYSCQLEIRWSDFDQSGEITDTTYIELAREARLRFIRDTWIRHGHVVPPMMVRHLDVDYLKPLLLGMNRITVDLHVKAVSGTSYTLQHILSDYRGDTIAIVNCVIVAFDTESHQHIELEPAVRLMLTELQNSEQNL